MLSGWTTANKTHQSQSCDSNNSHNFTVIGYRDELTKATTRKKKNNFFDLWTLGVVE